MPWRKGNRLKRVEEEEADEATRLILRDIRQALGVPRLKLFYPALAAYPSFLRLHWKLFCPLAHSAELWAAAERLRADAYTRAHNYFRISDLNPAVANAHLTPGAQQELRRAIEYFHHQDPLLLLLLAAQWQALGDSVGQARPVTPTAPPLVLAEAPLLIDDESAPPAVRRKFDEIRRVLELPFLNTEFRALARWPDVLDVYWDMLRPLLQSPIYQECQYGVRETALLLARDLPGPLEMTPEQLIEAGINEQDVGSVARIIELFVKTLSGLVLNIAVAKIALEGGNQAAAEPSASASDASRKVKIQIG